MTIDTDLEAAACHNREVFAAETERLGATPYGQAFTAAGLAYITTGGGCTGWAADLPHDGWVLITAAYEDGESALDAEPDEHCTVWQVAETYYGDTAPDQASWEFRTFPIADHTAAAAYAADLHRRRTA